MNKTIKQNDERNSRRNHFLLRFHVSPGERAPTNVSSKLWSVFVRRSGGRAVGRRREYTFVFVCPSLLLCGISFILHRLWLTGWLIDCGKYTIRFRLLAWPSFVLCSAHNQQPNVLHCTTFRGILQNPIYLRLVRTISKHVKCNRQSV